MIEATCIADLEDKICKLPDMPDITKPIGKWQHGEDIYIRGLWTGKGKSVFGNAKAIRWECPDYKFGLFHKGLACYMRPLPAWAEKLPKSK